MVIEMSEKREGLSQRALLIIGVVSLLILVVGIILYFVNLNEAFYSESLEPIFKIITYLGEPVVFIIITMILFLTYSKNVAKNLASSLLFSYYMNGVVKQIFKDLRPVTNEDITEDYGYIETSYGFPSGHTQNAVAFWGYAGYEFKDKYEYKRLQVVPILISILIFLVAMSRIIIGVHDLQDIIGGLLLGTGFLLLFIYLEPFLSDQFNKLSFLAKIIITIIVVFSLFFIATLLFPSAGLGIVSPPSEYRDTGAFGQAGGALLGFGIGYLLEQEYVKYDPSLLTKKNKTINIILGILILLVVFIPFEYLLEIDSVFYRFFRYALVTFVLAYIVPLICKKINSKL
jgi:membrane-associated phospholipid phosphatase